jgi:hypothetical protein
LRTLQPRLLARYREVMNKEQVQNYVTKRNELAPERDALDQELRDAYQDAASKLINLFARISAFQQRAARELGNPPAGVGVLPDIAWPLRQRRSASRSTARRQGIRSGA